MEPVQVQFPKIPVPVKQVLRRLGYPTDHKIEPGMRQMIDAEIESSHPLLQFRGTYTLLQIASSNAEKMTFQDSSFVIESVQAVKMLNQADRVAIFMVTIGDALEKHVKELLDIEEPTRAFILDAVGSETVDALADYLHWKVLSNLAENEGCKVTPRFSPGYGDWKLTIQSEIHRV
ncbi:hypothetical protein HQ585_10185, partial [candidate division KSB1 bacterium]|nr:hypothetical protein [candidate division KSB1 bacterium]